MIEEYKQYAEIDDSDRDTKLSFIISAAKKYLSVIFGIELDYTNDEYKQLLFERVRYVDANAAHLFEQNFATEILRIQLDIAANEVQLDEYI